MAKKYMSENDYKNADYTNGYAKNEADKATDKGRIRLRINLRTRTVRIIPKTVARILLMQTGTAVSQDKVQTAEKRHMIK